MSYGPQQIEFLHRKNYLQENEELEDRIETIRRVVERYEHLYSDGLADRIANYIKDQILSPSTPQWANIGRENTDGTSPLPASCYIITPENSIQGIYYSIGETAMMSKLGGGVGADWTSVYNKGTKIGKGFYTNPKLDWVEDQVRAGQKVSQGNQRRGYTVPFISIDDPEFYTLLDRTKKSNPDKTDPLVENNVGIILPIGFWKRLKNETELKKRFLAVLYRREETGKVYLVDVENCNKNQSPVYEKLGHTVHSTNICCEITTPKYANKSFVCVICSLNLVHWDKIKADPQIIKDAYMFLDISTSEFIRLTENVPFMEKARRSAIEKRDIGLGTLGFHEYLQMNDCAYGSLKSMQLNEEVYATIREVGEEYTAEIGAKLGSPKMCQDAEMVRRNVSLMMVAPNKSTSFICGGTSLGVEPFLSNYFVKALAGIQATFRNPYLSKRLDTLGKNTPEVWQSILENLGSVSHLDFLSDHEKGVFRTANEISPKDIINLASQRQKYIDMAQSINLFNRPNYSKQDIYNIHKYAFENDLKTLYYYYSQAHAAREQAGEAWDTCESCAD